jgi:DNA topoisomerase-1
MFEFKGKSGIKHAVDFEDARLARIVKACRDLPGYELFQYVDDRGRRQRIGSADVNAYLREITREEFTAKDFRTWAGTVLAAQELAAFTFSSAAQARRNVVKVVERVACRLGNTKAVCRKSYIHPAVFDAYMDGVTLRPASVAASRPARDAAVRLTPAEAAVVGLLERRLAKTA